jgi:hypothetical protein
MSRQKTSVAISAELLVQWKPGENTRVVRANPGVDTTLKTIADPALQLKPTPLMRALDANRSIKAIVVYVPIVKAGHQTGMRIPAGSESFSASRKLQVDWEALLTKGYLQEIVDAAGDHATLQVPTLFSDDHRLFNRVHVTFVPYEKSAAGKFIRFLAAKDGTGAKQPEPSTLMPLLTSDPALHGAISKHAKPQICAATNTLHEQKQSAFIAYCQENPALPVSLKFDNTALRDEALMVGTPGTDIRLHAGIVAMLTAALKEKRAYLKFAISQEPTTLAALKKALLPVLENNAALLINQYCDTDAHELSADDQRQIIMKFKEFISLYPDADIALTLERYYFEALKANAIDVTPDTRKRVANSMKKTLDPFPNPSFNAEQQKILIFNLLQAVLTRRRSMPIDDGGITPTQSRNIMNVFNSLTLDVSTDWETPMKAALQGKGLPDAAYQRLIQEIHSFSTFDRTLTPPSAEARATYGANCWRIMEENATTTHLGRCIPLNTGYVSKDILDKLKAMLDPDRARQLRRVRPEKLAVLLGSENTLATTPPPYTPSPRADKVRELLRHRNKLKSPSSPGSVASASSGSLAGSDTGSDADTDAGASPGAGSPKCS